MYDIFTISNSLGHIWFGGMGREQKQEQEQEYNWNWNLIPIPVFDLISVELTLELVLRYLISHWNGMQYNYFDKNTIYNFDISYSIRFKIILKTS